MGGSTGEIGGDVPFIGFVVECVYEAGRRDRGSKALEGAERAAGSLKNGKILHFALSPRGRLYTHV